MWKVCKSVFRCRVVNFDFNCYSSGFTRFVFILRVHSMCASVCSNIMNSFKHSSVNGVIACFLFLAECSLLVKIKYCFWVLNTLSVVKLLISNCINTDTINMFNMQRLLDVIHSLLTVLVNSMNKQGLIWSPFQSFHLLLLFSVFSFHLFLLLFPFP